MKVIDVNHGIGVEEGMIERHIPDQVTHLKVRGAGVVVTLVQRPDEGIDITINPVGQDYMHNIKTHEVYVSGSQVRVTGAKGSAF